MSAFKFDQIKKLQRNRTLMILMVLSLVVVLVWTSVSLFSSQSESKLPNNIVQLTSPLNPSIDRVLLNMIQEKRVFNQSELEEFPIYKILIDKGTKQERVVTIDTTLDDLLPTATPVPTNSPLPEEVISAQEQVTSTPDEPTPTSGQVAPIN